MKKVKQWGKEEKWDRVREREKDSGSEGGKEKPKLDRIKKEEPSGDWNA